ncbi:hypothetical protein Poly41_36200 [Novipirellula artificiosorum]|uniref:Uncharacterized protein n=1 Tax=Novipirellula artificiosorum TaxID=2528016 RepID=A0A5C6DLX9_9BACT|nr:hypothetical protein Poly41_36200 [Novipirellula artificiosorum]
MDSSETDGRIRRKGFAMQVAATIVVTTFSSKICKSLSTRLALRYESLTIRHTVPNSINQVSQMRKLLFLPPYAT